MELEYKEGDKVKIRTWKNLEREYGLNYAGNISAPSNRNFFAKIMENIINKEFPDRILTIAKKEESYYYMKGIAIIWAWCDYMIEGLVKEENIVFDPIVNRFELMDFDG